MKQKTKRAIGVLTVLIIALAGIGVNNFLKKEKAVEEHLEQVEQQVVQQMEVSAQEAQKLAEEKNKEAKKVLQNQLMDHKRKKELEEQRRAEIRAQEIQMEKEQLQQMADEHRDYMISITFDKIYEPREGCIDPKDQVTFTMCTNERRRAKVEFEKQWDAQNKEKFESLQGQLE